MERNFIGDLSRARVISRPAALRSRPAAPCGACRIGGWCEPIGRSPHRVLLAGRRRGCGRIAKNARDLPRPASVSTPVDARRRRVGIVVGNECAGARRRPLDAVIVFARRKLLAHV
jgi:hypothetical protein